MKYEEKNDFSNLQTDFALDTSILIYLYYRSKERITDIIMEKNCAVNEVTLSETMYILCRKEGLKNSLEFIRKCRETFVVIPSEHLYSTAAEFKCKYPISLADCWVLATAKVLHANALFLHKEREIDEIIDVLQEDVRISFLLEVESS